MLVHFDATVRSGRLSIPTSLKNGAGLLREAEELRTKLASTGRATVIRPEAMHGQFNDMLVAAAMAVAWADWHQLAWDTFYSKLFCRLTMKSTVSNEFGAVEMGDVW